MEHREQIRQIENGVVVAAPAKINLSLLVDGKRADGFHKIETVIAKINFYDEILIDHSEKKGIEFVCEGPCWAPEGEGNLIFQAGKKLLEQKDCQANIKITLRKNVPAGSGLGSASSDAAGTLIGLNRLLRLGVGDEELFEIAAGLGSDVAFFLGGPLAFCTGKGEKIKKIGEIFNFLAVLVLPDISVSTKMVYENYEPNMEHFEQLGKRVREHILKNRIDFVAKMCTNMLEKSCFSLNRGLAELKKRLESIARGPWCLSGSGSAMYRILEDADEIKASSYQEQIKKRIGCESIIVNNNRW